jgi:hypothetical protein
MPRLTFEEIEQLARQAGFSDDVSPTMAAIALAESGGDPMAHNPNASTGDNSYGLMQINMLGAMGPERRAAFNLQSNEELFDPVTNFKAAKDIYDSQGLNAWSVHRSGAYKQFLPKNFTPLQGQLDVSAPKNKKPRFATQTSGDDDLYATMFGNIAKEFGLDGGSGSPERMAMSGPLSMPVAPNGDGVGIVELGKQLEGMGFQVREHPEFGGVGQHSPNSHHYAGNAIDVTIQRGSPLLAGRPDSDWQGLTSQYGSQLRQMYPGAEIFHPGYDPVGGHSEHIHIAFPGGRQRRS